VHQRGGPADVFQAGPQLHHQQGPGRGHDRNRLVEGQRLGWPAVLAFGGVGQGGDVAVEYPAAIVARARRTSAVVSSRSLRAPVNVRIGARTFWFFVMVLGERPSSPVASQSSAACRTV
jgi:hypothetical protein